MGQAIRPGDVLAGRYRLVDLLTETGGGRFWRARDQVLERTVALHVLDAEDGRTPRLLKAARSSATVQNSRLLRVLDAEVSDGICYVVNEWGSGTSLDVLVAAGPLGPRRSAWLVAEVADSLAAAHAQGVPHGRLVPENILIDQHGEIRIIGHGVDAALHGLPLDRPSTDILDLAGLLYCALTTRWGGSSESVVAAAPREQYQVIRPRRVRAGVPRPLDVLCDEVLHPHLSGRRALGDITTAAGIHDYLAEFVGDPAGLPAAMLASCPDRREPEQVVLPAIPEQPVKICAPEVTQEGEASQQITEPAQTEADDRTDETGWVEALEEPHAAVEEDRPTEAGMPIFGADDDDVEWFQARASRPTPPPAFKEPASKPLFAPEPEDGGPVRVPRGPGQQEQVGPYEPAGRTAHASLGYGLDGNTSTDATPVPKSFWPWETMGGGRHGEERPDEPRHQSRSSSSTDDADEVPGRNWVRLGMGVLALLVLAVAILVAFTITRGPDTSDPEPDSNNSAGPTPGASEAPTLSGLSATDLDPAGDPDPRENPELAPLVVDGDRSTFWQTEGYFDQLGPSGLKTGVGVIVDLGESTEISGVEVFFQGAPTDASLYLTDEAPSDVADLEPIASGTASETSLQLEPEPAAAGRYLVVWLTALPADGDRFRGRVAEVVVRGAQA